MKYEPTIHYLQNQAHKVPLFSVFASNIFLFFSIFSICFINKCNWHLIQDAFVTLRLNGAGGGRHIVFMCYHENNVPFDYYHNDFVATYALGHITYGYTWLVPMNQRMFIKLSKEYKISDHKWSMAHRVLKSHRSKMSILTYMLSW